MRQLPLTLIAVAVGGAAGALLRFGLGSWVPDGDGFPWTTFAINVAGSLTLAMLPALARVRRSPVLADALGPGLLGGFTTLSAYSEQLRDLLSRGHVVTAGTYLAGTLAACLVAVALADRLSTPAERVIFEHEGGDL